MKYPREKPSTSQMLTYNPVKKIVKSRPCIVNISIQNGKRL